MLPEFPKATARPCNDCPWRREAIPGWLGPHTAEEWVFIAHGETAIACHQTIVADEDGNGDWSHPDIRQCRGAAIFRANVCKSPHNPTIETGPRDTESVFSWNDEFLEHHALVRKKRANARS